MVKEIKYNRLLQKFVNYLKNDTKRAFVTADYVIYYDKKTQLTLIENGAYTLHISIKALKHIGVIDCLEREDVINTISKLFNPNNRKITTNG